MRSTPRTSRASVTYEAGPSSPAWATRRSPASAARRYTSRNLAGGLPTSAESRPMPVIRSKYGRAASKVSSADSADSSRRKHMISWVLIPYRSSLRSSAAVRPSTTTPSGTPRAVCACGSKKISACRTPCSAARAR